MRRFATVLGFALITSTLYGQTPSPWELADPPAFHMHNIVIAKTKDAETVSMMLPQWTLETRSRMLTVTRMRTEIRTRTAERDGQTITEEYAVEVPYTEQIEQTYTVQVLEGKVRRDLPVAELTVWDLNGTKLSAAQVLQRLNSATHVYRLPDNQPLPISPYHAAVLNRNLLFVHHPQACPQPQ